MRKSVVFCVGVSLLTNCTLLKSFSIFTAAEIFEPSTWSKRKDEINQDLIVGALGSSNINCKNTIIRDVDLSGMRLVNFDFSGTTLINVDLRDADLQNVHLEGSTFKNVKFTGAILCWGSVYLPHYKVIKDDPESLILEYASLLHEYNEKTKKGDRYQIDNLVNKINCLNKILGALEVELNGSNFQGLDLSRINLSRANLTKVNFQNTIMFGVNMMYSKFNRCSFRGALLPCALLECSHFDEVEFEGANLSYASLEHSVLNQCKWQGGCFKNMRLGNAVLNKNLKLPFPCAERDLRQKAATYIDIKRILDGMHVKEGKVPLTPSILDNDE